MRGATIEAAQENAFMSDFNPRPPCGGRRERLPLPLPVKGISIHAPRAGGDPFFVCYLLNNNSISIHAPRAGGDVDAPGVAREFPRDFNPRPPCGGRQRICKNTGHNAGISIHAPRAGGDNVPKLRGKMTEKFQSTPPVRGATLLFQALKRA